MKIDFKKTFSKKKVFNTKDQNYINPHRGWRNLIWVSTFLGLLLIVFSLYLFFQIKKDQLFNIEKVEEVKTEVINQKSLERIVNAFEQKGKNREKILNKEINFKDPS